MRIKRGQIPGLLFALIPACLFAEEQVYTMEVQPSICVTHSSDQPCQMQLTVVWQAERPTDVCLHLAGNAVALHCWDSASEGSVVLAFRSAENITLQLWPESGGHVLEETLINVVSRDVRDSRRRRRHVWSIL